MCRPMAVMRVVVGQGLHHLRHVDIGLVADGEDAGQRQGARASW